MNILLIESQSLYRHGLSCLIESLSEDISVKSCIDVEDSFSYFGDYTHDLLLLSSRCELEICLESISRLVENAPDVPIILVPVAKDLEHFQQALQLGVKGIVPSVSCHKELLAVFRLVSAGGTYIPCDFISEENVVNIGSASGTLPCISHGDENTDFAKMDSLSDRQKQVLDYLIQGKPNKVISEALCISENTVKTHLSAIFKLLGVRNRNEAVYFASQASHAADKAQTTSRVSNF